MWAGGGVREGTLHNAHRSPMKRVGIIWIKLTDLDLSLPSQDSSITSTCRVNRLKGERIMRQGQNPESSQIEGGNTRGLGYRI